ncbi:hypothetical protein SAMN02745164_02063 [Marinitoga hydrogenitolerans DSM 16785]|uniref:Uncharacterized protein n=1 Tax=Marinitoga hydrogenitolerans (strain DSM 16785 / JCM 12826 / AT1271) TaxID=1122195 RepID=A0A1M5A0G5_MARH1|nr:hypothetical protein [Marinitoga hydrogenitolerans]SHF23597.1 hypothetical protein SAMN02745164_02063 [Marinitoga hydrogenitolerans DSM 16785]
MYLKIKKILTALFLSIAVILYLIAKIFRIAPNIIPLLLPTFIPLLNSIYYSIIFIVGFLFITNLFGLFFQAFPLVLLFFIPHVLFVYSKKNRFLISSLSAIIAIISILRFFPFYIPKYIFENKILYMISIIIYIFGINIYNIIVLELSKTIKGQIKKYLGVDL